MKAISLIPLSVGMMIISLSKSGFAITTKDLTLQCGGSFRVLKSEPYYGEHAPRLGGFYYGLKEDVQVLSISGKDCAKLEPGYQISLKVGQVHKIQSLVHDYPGYGGIEKMQPKDIPYSQMPTLAKARLGQVYPFKVTQHFGLHNYKTQELPLFPLIHNETAYVLSLAGQANAQKLYGTPTELTAAQTLSVMKKITGILMQGSLLSNPEFFGALLELQPKSLAVAQEYTDTLLNLFELHTKKSTALYSYDEMAILGKKLNFAIQVSGGTKFKSPIQIFQEQPLLLSETVISEWFEGPKLAPKLTAAQVEAFLEFALQKSQALKAVGNQVNEAWYLLYQYQLAGKSIQKFSLKSLKRIPPYEFPAVFVLTPKSKQLLQALLAL